VWTITTEGGLRSKQARYESAVRESEDSWQLVGRDEGGESMRLKQHVLLSGCKMEERKAGWERKHKKKSGKKMIKKIP